MSHINQFRGLAPFGSRLNFKLLRPVKKMAELAEMKKIIKEQKNEIKTLQNQLKGTKNQLKKVTEKLERRSLKCPICEKLLANKQSLK